MLEKGLALFDKARPYLESGEPEKALPFLEQALDHFIEAGPGANPQQAALLNNLGHLRVAAGDLARALESFGRAAELFLKMGDIPNQAFQWQNMGSVHRDRQDWAEAVDCYTRALDLFENASMPVEAADQHANQAHALAMMGHGGQALAAFEKAGQIYRNHGEEKKAALVEGNLSILRAEEG